MSMSKAMEIINEQENLFQFLKFTNEDAYNLGVIFVEEFKDRGLSAALRIRRNNGYTVFQYGTDGTGINHENWMTRKENTVDVLAMSTMKTYLTLKEGNMKLWDMFLDEAEFSDCPGCFPINVKDVGIVGTITVSGISVLVDHEIIMDCLEKFFSKKSPHLTEEML